MSDTTTSPPPASGSPASVIGPVLAGLFEFLKAAGRKLRWLLLGFVLLVLQWPLGEIDRLVREREQRRQEATEEVMAHFGQAQTVIGPVLTVPFRVWTVEEREVNGKLQQVRRWHRSYGHFLPAELAVSARAEPEIRRRGLFEIPVYTAELEVKGRFDAPELRHWSVADEDVLWQETWLSVEVTDRKALTAPIRLTLGGEALGFEVGAPEGAPLARSLQARLAADTARKGGAFAGRISLRGSARLAAAPMGGRTTMEVSSSWPHPSFDGAYLPEHRSVSAQGFEARWSVLRFGRDFGQQWTQQALDANVVQASSFGVAFKNPTDLYAQVARSTRYSLLFLLMTFLVLYLWEVLRRTPIHPLQYLLFGFALLMFYVLELALSEHFGFAGAYACAAGGIVLLIGLYARAILASSRSAATLGAMLAGLYAFLFVTLRAEDHALLIGALGLTALLAGVMYGTRRLHARAAG
jgi:inner membrane protein